VCDEQNFLNDVAEGNNFILITFTRFKKKKKKK
jgi:hypothetical protein